MVQLVIFPSSMPFSVLSNCPIKVYNPRNSALLLSMRRSIAEKGKRAHMIGKTLAQTIPPGGLPVATVLECGVQIADALASAHAAGPDGGHQPLPAQES